MRYRRAKFKPVGDILDTFLANRRIFHASKERVVALVWADTVGAWFGRNSVVLDTKDGVVSVQCNSAAVAQELDLRKGDVIARLNERLGGEIVTDLRASTGGIRRERLVEHVPQPTTEPAPTERELALVSLAREEEARIEAVGAAIDDPDLRARYSAAAANALRLARWQKLQGYEPCGHCGVLAKPLTTGYCTVCWAQMPPDTRARITAEKAEEQRKASGKPKRLKRPT